MRCVYPVLVNQTYIETEIILSLPCRRFKEIGISLLKFIVFKLKFSLGMPYAYACLHLGSHSNELFPN